MLPQPHHLLASDTEREQIAEALRGHAAAGRLDTDELEQRLEQALDARTRADLVPLVADLPAAPPPPQRQKLPRVPAIVPVAILLLAIWTLTGAGYFWPMWPIGGMLIGAFKGHGHRSRVLRHG